ncbi:MAG: TIGR02597 family protein [Verrucomicrobiota bacterium]
MKSLNKAKRPLAGLLAAALLGSAGSLKADEVYSQIVGAIAIDVPGNSEVLLSFPFKRSASFRGSVASSTSNVLTLDNSSFSDDEFNTGYYVFIEEDTAVSNNKMGRRFNITDTTATTLTVDVDGDDLSGLIDGVISVRPHWTLDSAFPNGFGFVDVTDDGEREVELIVPTRNKVKGDGDIGIEKYYYFHDGKWRDRDAPTGSDAGGSVLRPGESILVLNNTEATIRSYFFGEVVDAPLAIPVLADASENVDNFVGLERPLAITLDDLLGDSGVGIDDILETGDELLVYSLELGENKDPTRYEYTGSQWQVVGGDGSDKGSELIEPEQAIAIRRAAGNTSSTWVNEWSLPQ